jgi:hypothetical protein
MITSEIIKKRGRRMISPASENSISKHRIKVIWGIDE